MITITQEHGHFVVKRDGVFYCSADSYAEALDDVAECEKENKENNGSG